MVGYLLDTNIISGYLSAKYNAEFMKRIAEELDSSAKISIITQIELLCWKADSDVELLIKEFIKTADVIGLTKDVADKCVELRRKHSIKIPDAIIAATAVTQKLFLITENEKDFANIKGLKILKPE